MVGLWLVYGLIDSLSMRQVKIKSSNISTTLKQECLIPTHSVLPSFLLKPSSPSSSSFMSYLPLHFVNLHPRVAGWRGGGVEGWRGGALIRYRLGGEVIRGQPGLHSQTSFQNKEGKRGRGHGSAGKSRLVSPAAKPEELRSVPRTCVKNPEAEAHSCNPDTAIVRETVETGSAAEARGPASLGHRRKQNKTQQKLQPKPEPDALKQSYDKQ